MTDTPGSRDERRRARFPRERRLVTRLQYDRVFGEPERYADRYFTILVRSNDLGHPRLGMAVSKRNVRRATRRNRLKRLVREAFRLRSGLGGLDLVVLPKRDADAADAARLAASLDRLLARIAKRHSGDHG